MWNTDPAIVAAGTRVRLTQMTDDPDPIEPGTEGTVTGGFGGQVWIEWDNGRTLNLLTGIDTFEVLHD